MDRLSEIRARCVAFENSNDSYKCVRPEYILPVLADDGYPHNWADIAAHSHEDTPYLLEENAQLRAEVGRLIDLAGDWKEAADRYHAERNQLQEANRWIPVGERLPDNGVNVLCKWGHDKAWHKGVVIGYQHSGVWYFPEISMSYWTDITHWRPLPELPKGE